MEKHQGHFGRQVVRKDMVAMKTRSSSIFKSCILCYFLYTEIGKHFIVPKEVRG